MFITNCLDRLLDKIFDKKTFKCGNNLLDSYLHTQANQDIKKHLAVVFILGEAPIIKGYYTLSSNSVPRDSVPEDIKKKMPSSYDTLPVILIGRLAIDINFKRKGLGSALLVDALKRCYLQAKSGAGAIAVVVDPIDDEAKGFYEKYGFIVLPSSGKMFIPIKTIESILYS